MQRGFGMFYLTRKPFKKVLFPVFLLLYTLSIGTLIEDIHPNIKHYLYLFLVFLLPGFLFFNKEIQNHVFASFFLAGLWTILVIKNIFFGQREGLNMMFIGMFFIFIMSTILYRDMKELKYIEWSFLGFSFINIAYAIVHYLIIVGILKDDALVNLLNYERIDILRVAGIYHSPLQLGAFMVMLLNYLLFTKKKSFTASIAIVIVTILGLLTGNKSSFLLILLSFLLYALYIRTIPTTLLYFVPFFLALVFLPADYYQTALQRVTVLSGESTTDRIVNNTQNLNLLFENPINILVGTGYKARVTDSDLMTFALNYGIIFTFLFYGSLVFACLYIGLPQKIVTYYDGFKVFLFITIIEKILNGLAVGGTLSPPQSGYLFAFLGAMLSIKSNESSQIKNNPHHHWTQYRRG